MTDDVLIYSLSEHRDLIFDLLAAVGPERIVEIGSEAAGMTREMVTWAERNDAHFAAVEPFPIAEVRAMADRSASFDLVEGRSPDALDGVEPADVYLVGGDH